MKRIEIEKNLQLLAVSGSHSYGLATAESDQDYKGIFIATDPYYFGFKNIEQKDSGWDEKEAGLSELSFLNGSDTVVYELRKYVSLLLKNNPNILELLYLNPNHYRVKTDLAEELIKNRDLFLSKKIKYSLVGYASSQLGRLASHRKWLLNPPKEKPRLEDFSKDKEWQPITKSELNAFLEFLYYLVKDRLEFLEEVDEIRELYLSKIDLKAILKQHDIPQDLIKPAGDLTRASKDYIHLLHQTQSYRKALSRWNSYKKWLETRNKKRAALEAKCGYDAKHASHCLRLLTMGIEALNSGTLKVDRTNIDAEFLLNVKQGNVEYTSMMKIADTLFAYIDLAFDASKLQPKPQYEAANALCASLVKEFLL